VQARSSGPGGTGNGVQQQEAAEQESRQKQNAPGATKLMHQLHMHAVQYASKIVQTRRGLEFAASASNPWDPH